jgi:hypothetical protein
LQDSKSGTNEIVTIFLQDYLVAVGYHTLALLDAETGYVQVESRLPTVVNGPVVVGDWDSDGDNDIIVPCING